LALGGHTILTEVRGLIRPGGSQAQQDENKRFLLREGPYNYLTGENALELLVARSELIALEESRKDGPVPEHLKEPWEKTRESVLKICDGLGYGMDEGIIDTVTAMILAGINTTQSCEGHLNSSVLTPWIEIGMDQSNFEERFVGQNKAINKELKNFEVPLSFRVSNFRIMGFGSLTVEKIAKLDSPDFRSSPLFGKFLDAQSKIMRKFYDQNSPPETAEFSQKCLYSENVKSKLDSLIDKFYSDRKVPDNIKVSVYRTSRTSVQLECGRSPRLTLNKCEEAANNFDISRDRERFLKDSEYRNAIIEGAHFTRKESNCFDVINSDPELKEIMSLTLFRRQVEMKIFTHFLLALSPIEWS